MGETATSTKVRKGREESTLKVLEFYSGIGGMHAALARAAKAGDIPAFEVLAALDINDVANRVYAHNFGEDIVRRVHSLCAMLPDFWAALPDVKFAWHGPWIRDTAHSFLHPPWHAPCKELKRPLSPIHSCT
jgi:hypothetical protein